MSRFSFFFPSNSFSFVSAVEAWKVDTYQGRILKVKILNSKLIEKKILSKKNKEKFK